MPVELGEWDLKYTREYDSLLARAIVTPHMVMLFQRDFDRLPEYSCTMPTGVYANKVWKRCEPFYRRKGEPVTWYMGHYGMPDECSQCATTWRKIVLRPEPPMHLVDGEVQVIAL